jgi:hypothetical protein
MRKDKEKQQTPPYLALPLRKTDSTFFPDDNLIFLMAISATLSTKDPTKRKL